MQSPPVQVLAGGAVPTNDPTGGYFKGVFELDWNTNVTAVQVSQVLWPARISCLLMAE